MATGPGKYDDMVSMVRQQIGMTDSGGVVLIVIGGERGPGFSCQADLPTTLLLPDLLELVAKQMRKDIAG